MINAPIAKQDSEIARYCLCLLIFHLLQPCFHLLELTAQMINGGPDLSLRDSVDLVPQSAAWVAVEDGLTLIQFRAFFGLDLVPQNFTCVFVDYSVCSHASSFLEAPSWQMSRQGP